MKLASAQTKPIRGDINSNLKEHYRLIEIASDNGANLIVFPEMSISGYERVEAHKYAFLENDSRLDKMRAFASNKKIIIIAGAPIKIESDLFIGEFILFPDDKESIYTKQFLHTGEDQYFKSSFAYNPIIEIDKERISLAICADIDHPVHAENAGSKQSSIYIPSIFFSINGISKAHESLKTYALKNKMNVLMSNFSGQSWGTYAGGRSAFWNNEGELVIEMNGTDSGLLVVEKNKEQWYGKIIN
ncbi:MAG TPA: carbon-nitrogen hydrolase family protein [Saprospiraceae bacterium]|nr:carbon-nitrogen hydrolase family protein [Saprospiraceae bacterium]